MIHLTQGLSAALEEAGDDLPAVFRQLIRRLLDRLKELDHQVSELELQIQRWHRESTTSQKLAQIPGIGAITASAMVASIGDARCFKNGRQLAAWLGLVPRQHSSGGKPTLLEIQ
jgi:transposase